MFEKKMRPGLILGMYPQQQETWPSVLETQARIGVARVKYLLESRKYKLNYIVNKVNKFEQAISWVRESIPGAIETEEQQYLVKEFGDKEV